MPVSTPEITSNGGGDTATISVNEGVVTVTTVTATDLDGDALTYSLVTDLTNGPDKFKFKIDATTGVLTFILPPDFEALADSNHDNIYKVKVQVSDGTLVDTQIISINLQDVLSANITGTSGDDSINPSTVNPSLQTTVEGDTINAHGGNDTIDGDLGADSMTGGDGDDIYYVDNVGDVVTELMNSGSGHDKVYSSVSFAMGTEDGIDDLELIGTANINGTGNWLGNIITGNSGANILDGATGTDTLIGGSGNDTYITDGGDTITEVDGGGTDLVKTSATITMADFVENAEITSTGSVDVTGNALNNVIKGNTGNNILLGGDGNDTLYSGTGGTDSMEGGLGNDIYYVDNATTTVKDVAKEGTDEVRASVSFSLGNQTENLTLTGTGAIAGTGNNNANTITGNTANNHLMGLDGADILNGGLGADSMEGGDGNDTYTVDNASDAVVETSTGGTKDEVKVSLATYTLADNVENMTMLSGSLTATGNALDNIITGNGSANTINGGDGNDRLYGLGGSDSMAGGAGNDTYYVTDAGDTVTEDSVTGSGDADKVVSTLTISSLAANVENATLNGFGATSATGNGLANTLIGNTAANTLTGLAGNDKLDGGRGLDTLVGGDGNDTYYIRDLTSSVADTVNETGTTDSAADEVISTIGTYTLTANVEILTLGGNLDINGTGNGDANTLNGNKGWNVLDGAGGDDTISGGQGADTIIGGAGKDTMTGGSGTDTFTFKALGDSTTSSSTADVITDFSTSDVIDLSAIDAKTSGIFTGDQGFVVSSDDTLSEGEIVMTRSGNVITLTIDTDSTSGANMVLMITVDSSFAAGAELTAANFIL